MDLSSVATVDESFATGLGQAINNASNANNYNATSIANAIYNYDNNIAGVYWPLNEINSGDGSDYYLLARDITDDSEYTDEFYGLVSASGVTGTILVSSGLQDLFGNRGANMYLKSVNNLYGTGYNNLYKKGPNSPR